MGAIKKEVLYEPINTVYLNDFGDLYHELDEDREFNELERRARSLKKRYRNIMDYNEAVYTFYEYLIHLNKKYGVTEELFGMMLEAGTVNEFVPTFPQLKGTRRTKKMIKANIIEGRGTGKIISHKALDEYIESLNLDYSSKDVPLDHKLKPVSDKAVMRLAEAIPSLDQKSFRKDINKMSDIDFLDEYFKAKKIMSKKKSEVFDDDEDELTFVDWYEGNYEMVDDVKEDGMVWYEGSLVNREELEDIKTSKYIRGLGWNVLKLLTGSGISQVDNKKSAEKELDPTIAAVLKRHDKMEKKRKKKKKKNDDFLARIMSDNDYDTFEDFESDMFSLSAPDSAHDGRFD